MPCVRPPPAPLFFVFNPLPSPTHPPPLCAPPPPPSCVPQDLFAAYDKDKNGTISFEELTEGLRGQGYVVNESEVRP